MTNLPPLNMLATRSFWSGLVGFVAVLTPSLGLPVFDEVETVDTIMQVVGAVLLAFSYYQRANPSRSVTPTGPMT